VNACKIYYWLVLTTVVGAVAPAAGMGPRPPRLHDVDGITYVRIDQAARGAGLAFSRSSLAIHAGDQRLSLEPERRRARFNRQLVWLHEPVRKVGRRWAMAEVDMRTVVEPLFHPEGPWGRRPAHVVVLDPGHGGEDRGAEGPAPTVEKTLTLDVCRRIRNLLTAQGVRVKLTRTTDQFLALAERPRLAAGYQADLFVSVHFNAAGNPDATGVETYALTEPGCASTADFAENNRDPKAYPGNAQAAGNTVLAWTIHHHLQRIVRAEDRGIRRARFAVLRDAPCPAVLVECGFLSNADEEARILLPHYRQGIAEGIAAGIRDYVRQVQLARAGAGEPGDP
jgi:N-acetylmuramoyl-L-alanine amidase